MTRSPSVILASGSPRRHQLLEMLGIPHAVDSAAIGEVRRLGEAPVDYARRLSLEKAQHVSVRHPGEWVLGGDTVVVLDGDVLEKPESTEAAVTMISRLSGRQHEVVSALALVRGDAIQQGHDVTSVWFRELDEALIRAYVATGESLDKAGAYGAQGKGAALIRRIDGDYYGVMGLPVGLLVELLDAVGMPYRFTR